MLLGQGHVKVEAELLLGTIQLTLCKLVPDLGHQSSFPTVHKVGNNANVGIEAIQCKNKSKSINKTLPPVSIEPLNLFMVPTFPDLSFKLKNWSI